MKKIGCWLILSSIVLFWAVFFKLTPFLTSFLPNNEWSDILTVVIYFVIGWMGGIALPLAGIVFGIIFLATKN